MLYETLSQPKILIIFILVGIISGICFDVGNFVKFLFSNKKIFNHILDFIETILILFIVFISNLYFNYGCIRLYPILVFVISFWIERITIGKIVAKFYLKCYSLLIKLRNKIWRKNDKTNQTN